MCFGKKNDLRKISCDLKLFTGSSKIFDPPLVFLFFIPLNSS